VGLFATWRFNMTPQQPHRSFRALSFGLAALLSMFAASAQAGVIAAGQWTPNGCGPKPVAPVLDLSSPDAYNKSVDGVNGYRQAIRPYLDCLLKEANADIAAVTKSANAAQVAAKEANDKITADVKAADEKFK